jgi:hypothetical protein
VWSRDFVHECSRSLSLTVRGSGIKLMTPRVERDSPDDDYLGKRSKAWRADDCIH